MDQKQIDQLTVIFEQAEAKRADVVTAGKALLLEIEAWDKLKAQARSIMASGWKTPGEDHIANRLFTLEHQVGEINGAFEKTLSTFCEIHSQ